MPAQHPDADARAGFGARGQAITYHHAYARFVATVGGNIITKASPWAMLGRKELITGPQAP